MEGFVDAIGAVAETVVVFYHTLKQNGLDSNEAMELSKHLITAMMKK